MHDSLKDFDLEMWPPMLIAFSLNQTRGMVETLKNPVGLSDYSVVANISVLKTEPHSAISQMLTL